MPILSAKKLMVLCTFVVYSSCGEKPSIIFISPVQVKNVSESAVLNCTVHNPYQNTVIWMKRDLGRAIDYVIVSINSQKTVKDPRFQVTVSNEEASYLLHIAELQTTDTAIYECRIIIDKEVNIRSHVELLVRNRIYWRSNTWRLTSASESFISASGHTAELECHAESSPRPNITWIREYNASMPGGGHSFNGNLLEISSVAKEDRGKYYCVAENVFGKDKKHIEFEDEFAPVISSIGMSIAYDIKLKCDVVATAAPTILWYRNERELENNDKYWISNTTTIDELTYSIISFTTLSRYQYGYYYCMASIKVGYSEARINLNGEMVNALVSTRENFHFIFYSTQFIFSILF